MLSGKPPFTRVTGLPDGCPTLFHLWYRALWTFRRRPVSGLATPSVEGCLGRLDRRGCMAHELSWTFDCPEAPRRCAADSRRPCPLVRVGKNITNVTSACVLLPVPREDGFVTRCVRRAHPPGASRRQPSASGVASRCRPSRPAPPRTPRLRSWSRMRLMLKAGGAPAPRASNSVRLERKTTAGPANASCGGRRADSSKRTCYLVDPASSHMLVSKIKPCMCKYELIRTVKLRMAH